MKKNYFMPFLSPKKYKKALLVGLLALPELFYAFFIS